LRTIPCTRKLLKRLNAEAIIDPSSATNCLGNWYAKLGFVRRVPLIMLGSLSELASLARFEIEDNPSIDFVTLAVKLAETPCSPLKYESPRTVSLALLRHATS
jgi:hypothetical protein